LLDSPLQDTWLPEQVAFVQAMGNVRCNKYWEARLPRDFHRPPEADMGALRVYITDKYVNKRYALQGYSDFPCIENYLSHPFIVELAGGGKSCENGTAAVGAPKPPAAAAAVSEFDLLSLHDESTPACIPQQQRQQDVTATIPAKEAHGVDWDPFAAIAREPGGATSVPVNSKNTANKDNTTAAAAPILDPFAEIERTASSRSNAPAASLVQSSSPLGSSAMNGKILADPFTLPLVPPQSTATTTAAAGPLVKPVPSVAPLSMTSSGILGLAPMRSRSANGHSKGKVSHEDILAMFDK